MRINIIIVVAIDYIYLNVFKLKNKFSYFKSTENHCNGKTIFLPMEIDIITYVLYYDENDFEKHWKYSKWTHIYFTSFRIIFLKTALETFQFYIHLIQ